MKESFVKHTIPKVLSCPFCGGTNLTSAGWLNAFDEFCYFLQCDRCHVRGPESRTEKDAITNWSMRYHSHLNATIQGCDPYEGISRPLTLKQETKNHEQKH